MPGSFLCPYCGERRPDSERSDEHVLPAAIGCELITDLVCFDCNQRAGKEVDDPFLDELWVREMRHRHQVPDRRGRIPGPPVIESELTSDGSRALTIMDRAGWFLKALPVETWTDPSTLVYGVDATDAPEITQKKLERLRRETGRDVTLTSQTPRTTENPEATIKYQQSVVTWPRMGAKVALAVARMELDDTYLMSPAAEWLRSLLWGDMAQTAPDDAGISKHLAGETLDADVRLGQRPPEHQLVLHRAGQKVGIAFTLFGEVRYAVSLGTAASLAAPAVWALDPIARRVRRLSWEEWLVLSAERMVGANQEDD